MTLCPFSGRKLVLVTCIDCGGSGKRDDLPCDFCQGYGEIWDDEDNVSPDRVRVYAN